MESNISYVYFEDNLYLNSERTHWVPYLQLMVLKGLVSVSIRLSFFVMYTWTTVGFFPSRDLKVLVYLFEIYTQNIIFFFPMRFCETCATMQSVFTCYAVPNETN